MSLTKRNAEASSGSLWVLAVVVALVLTLVLLPITVSSVLELQKYRRATTWRQVDAVVLQDVVHLGRGSSWHEVRVTTAGRDHLVGVESNVSVPSEVWELEPRRKTVAMHVDVGTGQSILLAPEMVAYASSQVSKMLVADLVALGAILATWLRMRAQKRKK